MQGIVLSVGGILCFILIVRVCLENGEKNYIRKGIEIMLATCAVILTIIFGLIPQIIVAQNQNPSKMKKNIVGTSGRFWFGDHFIDIEADSEDQINVTEVRSELGTDDHYIVMTALVDVETPQVVLRNVTVIVEKNIFGGDTIVKWDYDFPHKKYYCDLDDDERGEYYDRGARAYINVAPNVKFTVKELMNYLGVYESYEVRCIQDTSVSENYDAMEYLILWKNIATNKWNKDWVRAEYNQDTNSWNLCRAYEKAEYPSTKSIEEVEKMEKNGELDEYYTGNYPDDLIVQFID